MLCALNQGLSCVSGRPSHLRTSSVSHCWPIPRAPDSVGLGWGLENLHFDEFPGAPDAALSRHI